MLGRDRRRLARIKATFVGCVILLGVVIGRRGTCLSLRFQTGSWMLFIDSRNSNKMAAVYTVQSIQLDSNFQLFIFSWRDLKNLLTMAAIHFFSVTNWLYTTRQSDEGVQTSHWRLVCFFNRQLVNRGRGRLTMLTRSLEATLHQTDQRYDVIPTNLTGMEYRKMSRQNSPHRIPQNVSCAVI